MNIIEIVVEIKVNRNDVGTLLQNVNYNESINTQQWNFIAKYL